MYHDDDDEPNGSGPEQALFQSNFEVRDLGNYA